MAAAVAAMAVRPALRRGPWSGEGLASSLRDGRAGALVSRYGDRAGGGGERREGLGTKREGGEGGRGRGIYTGDFWMSTVRCVRFLV